MLPQLPDNSFMDGGAPAPEQGPTGIGAAAGAGKPDIPERLLFPPEMSPFVQSLLLQKRIEDQGIRNAPAQPGGALADTHKKFPYPPRS